MRNKLRHKKQQEHCCTFRPSKNLPLRGRFFDTAVHCNVPVVVIRLAAAKRYKSFRSFTALRSAMHCFKALIILASSSGLAR